jgi:hypothetical protein
MRAFGRPQAVAKRAEYPLYCPGPQPNLGTDSRAPHIEGAMLSPSAPEQARDGLALKPTARANSIAVECVGPTLSPLP